METKGPTVVVTASNPKVSRKLGETGRTGAEL